MLDMFLEIYRGVRMPDKPTVGLAIMLKVTGA